MIILVIFVLVNYKTNKKNNRISPSINRTPSPITSDSSCDDTHHYSRLEVDNMYDTTSSNQSNEYNVLERKNIKDRIVTNNIYGSNKRDSSIYQNAVVRSFQNSIYNHNMSN